MVGTISPKTGFEPKISVAEACWFEDTVTGVFSPWPIRLPGFADRLYAVR
jgi:hypothetical protein